MNVSNDNHKNSKSPSIGIQSDGIRSLQPTYRIHENLKQCATGYSPRLGANLFTKLSDPGFITNTYFYVITYLFVLKNLLLVN